MARAGAHELASTEHRVSTVSWSLTDDLPDWAVYGGVAAAVCALLLLVLELRKRERLRVPIFLTGVLAVASLLTAVLRPVRVDSRGSLVGPRVLVLVDDSRRLLLPEGDGTRRDVARSVVEQLPEHFADARLTLLGFGSGRPRPFEPKAPPRALAIESDLVAAINHLADDPEERPKAVVVVSDGRLTRPAADAEDDALRQAVGVLGVPLYGVQVASGELPDASIRSVRAAGAAVAHQPLSLTIDVGCSGGLSCGNINVAVRELRQAAEPALLASGEAEIKDGKATIELKITLERAGDRIVEISIASPEGDRVPENDQRILSFSVARERIRLLHVAGRPTYDVRALRRWLKADESVDVVAFFILRTDQDEPRAQDESELSLIPFPVDELFTQHLPSFDAVVLQDIHAVRYRLATYLDNIATYVKAGGGLIMVGGETAFVGGGYASSRLSEVLPVELDQTVVPYDTVGFVPRATSAGRVAPVLGDLRELLGEDLPEQPGSNTLGPVRKGGLVLWEHPTRRAGKEPMPVLALGEAGDGRSIALGVDATHRLAFSRLAAKVAGRSYGALWDGLLGWLMRDPRYEAARIEVVGECLVGQPTKLRLHRLPGATGDVKLRLERLGVARGDVIERTVKTKPGSEPVDIDVGVLEPGGYSARGRVGDAPPTRQDFACEAGGEAWTDTRPDQERLDRLAEVTGGNTVTASSVSDLPLPESTRIAAERHVAPLLPAWVWSLFAALLLGAHWVLRRRGGLM